MIDKRVCGPADAVADIPDGSSIMIGGFGEAGSCAGRPPAPLGVHGAPFWAPTCPSRRLIRPEGSGAFLRVPPRRAATALTAARRIFEDRLSISV